MSEIIKFYSKKDIQREILRLCSNKEIAVKFGDKGFGKRPDILQFESDVKELAKQGATSFHCSEELWKDPLQLKPGMTRGQMDTLRTGFDLILDVDCKFIDYSKIAANIIIEALKFNGIRNISCKFSGGSGVHIAIPFESFPQIVNNIDTRLQFPEIPKAVANYIKSLIKPHLTKEILNLSSLDEIASSLNKQKKDLLENKELNPFKIVDIDPQLISSRHLFRCAYSLNEKTNLVSVPISTEKVKNFKISQAKISNIDKITQFVKREDSQPEEAKQLFIQALDFELRTQPKVEIKKRNYEIPKIAIQEKFFPQCINSLLKGVKDDGRKRTVFILTNFLQHMGWSYEDIQKALLEWNKKNYAPLKDGYIISQIQWAKRQQKKILPPNCDHEAYYKTLGVHCLNCKAKNPVNYVKIRLENEGKKNRG